MLIFGYLRASTSEQDSWRTKNALKAFAHQHGHRIAGWYVDNISGTALNYCDFWKMLNPVMLF